MPENTVISRKEAIEVGLTRYFTGRPCRHGHMAKRDVINCTCVECTRRWAQNNPELVKQYSYDYYWTNRNTILVKVKEFAATPAGKAVQKRTRDKHKVKRNTYSQLWDARNPGNRAQRTRRWYRRKGAEQRRTNILVKLASQLRSRLYMTVRHIRSKKAGSAVRDLGCSIEELRNHLERQFASGMTWENFGKEWEVDHIKPLGLFNLADRQQFLEVCKYTNLQPLFVADHKRKTVLDKRAILAARAAHAI